MVIVILGILAATALPRYINLKPEAETATLEAIKASLEGVAALIYGKSLVKGNHNIAKNFDPNNKTFVTVEGLEVLIGYGYPLGFPHVFKELAGWDERYKGVDIGTNFTTFVIYFDDGRPVPTSINDDCIVYYQAPLVQGERPIIKVNPCV